MHCACAGNWHWFADIDDADDPQPDDPFWYLDRCTSHSAALATACAQLAFLAERTDRGAPVVRVLEADLAHV